MTKGVIIYGMVVAGLVAAGIVASIALFGEEAADVLPGDIEQTIDKLPPSVAPEPTPDAHEERNAKIHADEKVKVISITGSATRAHGSLDEWDELAVGEFLGNEDKVKTSDASKVTLRVGEGSKLELAESAELSVGRTSERDRRFKLLHGRISVDYKEKDRRLRIENQDGSAAAETEEGIFTVLNTGATVAVATKTGSVDLFSGGERVAVLAGQQSVAAGGPPSKPRPIPLDVILRVVDPGCRVQREGFIVLKGRTEPGALVSANGNHATTQPDGRFSVKVPLRNGKNNIVVVTEDPSGNRKERTFPCVTVDPGAPIKKVNIKWGPSGRQEES